MKAKNKKEGFLKPEEVTRHSRPEFPYDQVDFAPVTSPEEFERYIRYLEDEFDTHIRFAVDMGKLPRMPLISRMQETSPERLTYPLLVGCFYDEDEVGYQTTSRMNLIAVPDTRKVESGFLAAYWLINFGKN